MSRYSRRLNGEKPEIVTDDERCLFCYQTESEGFDILRSAVRFPCCKKFAHRTCQARWEEENYYCAHCRKELKEEGVHHTITDPMHRGAINALRGCLEDCNSLETQQVSVTYQIFKSISNIFIPGKRLFTILFISFFLIFSN